VDLFHVMYRPGSMCVGVTVWFSWGGVVSLCRLKHYSPCTATIILFWMNGLLLNIIFDVILKIMRCWISKGSIATALQASGLEFWQG